MEAEKRELKELLNAFVDGDLETPPLCTAATKGNVGLVEMLLDKFKADKNCKDNVGETPLMKAADKGHLPVVEALLDAGVDVNIAAATDQSTALHSAANGGFDGIVNALLSKGADKDWRGAYGMTALMIAARNSDLPIVRCLLAKGADVDAVDDDGESALIFSLDEFDCGSLPEVIETVETVLAGGADANVGRTVETKYTPLGLAAAKGNIRVMKSLIAYGAGVNTPDCHGYPPLHVACEDRVGFAVVDFLLRSGADENALNGDGKTPANIMDESKVQDMVFDMEVRLLLVRASADRAWRRRGWLFMLRWRTLKAGGDGGDGGSGGSGARSVKQRGGAGGGKESFDLCAAVGWLRGVEEGVFRNVVGFL